LVKNRLQPSELKTFARKPTSSFDGRQATNRSDIANLPEARPFRRPNKCGFFLEK
jgi:hypothetical protein